MKGENRRSRQCHCRREKVQENPVAQEDINKVNGYVDDVPSGRIQPPNAPCPVITPMREGPGLPELIEPPKAVFSFAEFSVEFFHVQDRRVIRDELPSKGAGINQKDRH